MTYFQSYVYEQMRADGRDADAEAWKASCIANAQIPLGGMTEDEARDRATTRVYVDMCRGDIEAGCRQRGIKVTKNRSAMEERLIDALAAEYMVKSSSGK